MKKKTYLVYGWCVITAFLLLLICSRSSFLYPCNDWNDANSYFTMGKAMMNGQVIYRDLYDQKGPYLYLLYGIAYLLSNTSFAGVFVLEIIAVGTFLFAGYRTMNLYCSKRLSFLMVPLLGAVILASKSFYWGGAAEEFCLPLLGISLYHSLRYFKERYPQKPDWKIILVNGIFAGIVMQIKYTILGFFFAWMAMLVLAYLVRRDWKGLFSGCFIFLGSMMLTAIPWLIYFGAAGALDDWYLCYIYNNVFLYSNLSQEGNSLGGRIYTLAKLLYWLIRENAAYFVFIIIGVVKLVLARKSRWLERINIVMLCAFLFLGIYVGGSDLPYYAIPLTVFAIPGFAALGSWLNRAEQKVNSTLAGVICLVIVLAGSMWFAYAGSMNTYFMAQKREDYFLYRFRDIVVQEEAPTLVTVGCLDAGLYTVADVMPTCKFFQTNGINYEKMYVEQQKYVAEGKTQFVLARNEYSDAIWEHYELVAQEPYEWAGNEFTYYLFKRK